MEKKWLTKCMYNYFINIVRGSIACQMENFSCKVFQHCNHVDRCASANSLGIVGFTKYAMHTAHRELKSRTGRPAFVCLCASFSSFTAWCGPYPDIWNLFWHIMTSCAYDETHLYVVVIFLYYCNIAYYHLGSLLYWVYLWELIHPFT